MNFILFYTYMLPVFLLILLLIYFFLFKKNYVLGLNEDKKYGAFKLIFILFTTSTTSSILFWSIFEPFFYVRDTSLNLDIASPTFTRDVSFISFLHWGFIPLSIMTGMILVYDFFSKKYQIQNINFTTLFTAIFKIKSKKVIKLINIFVLTFFHISTIPVMLSAILFILLLSSSIFPIYSYGIALFLVVILYALIYFSASNKMKILLLFTKLTSILYIFIILICVVVMYNYYHKAYVIDSLLTIKDYLLFSINPKNIVSIFVGHENHLYNTWSSFFFAWWICGMITIPLFLLRVSVGYSIRQLITINIFIVSPLFLLSALTLGKMSAFYLFEHPELVNVNNFSILKAIIEYFMPQFGTVFLLILLVLALLLTVSTIDSVLKVVISYLNPNLDQEGSKIYKKHQFFTVLIQFIPTFLLLLFIRDIDGFISFFNTVIIYSGIIIAIYLIFLILKIFISEIKK